MIASITKRVTALVCFAAGGILAQVPTVTPRAGLVITRSVRVMPGSYRLAAPASLDSSVIVIRGDDITVDFTGVTLVGAPPDANPDVGAGVAIRVDGGRNVRITNARIRGYKVGILARGTSGLTLAGNDLSDNWRPRLFSLVEHESLVDWLSYHRNEKDEWLRFGAGAYLADVKGGEIRDNRVERGMNGVLLVRSDSLRIWNNVVSFNSGIGFGLYRSSDNLIAHNHADYNVRGYSHRFFKRGQDSAALLMYEQSCRNVVAYNSMTHSGDGLFLWAGQSTMDTGQGGSNDNLFFGNDFSFAPTNGMEATFSRNTFIGNRVEGSDHGLWGGYSFDSKVIGNEFRANRIGIAIEHGQNNEISGNLFLEDSTAIRLWANPIEPSDWGYPKHRDTRSRDYRIERNTFMRNRVGVRGSATSGASLATNLLLFAESTYVLADTTGWSFTDERGLVDIPRDPRFNPNGGFFASVPELPPEVARLAPPKIPGGLDSKDAPFARRDRSALIVTEWGPYDWRTPLLWPIDSTRRNPALVRVLGPEGRWRVVGGRGIASVSKDSGRTGDDEIDTLRVFQQPGAERDWELTVEHRAVTLGTGALGRPRRIVYGRFEPAIDWTLRFFTWTDSTADPLRDSTRFAELLHGTPAMTRQAPRLDYMWYRPTIQGIPQERFAIEASGTVTLGRGRYTLRTISDDGIRVWVDGRLAIDSWTPHESKVDNVALGPGRHDIRVQYYQLRGWTELRLEILRGAHTSEGSPGPH